LGALRSRSATPKLHLRKQVFKWRFPCEVPWHFSPQPYALPTALHPASILGKRAARWSNSFASRRDEKNLRFVSFELRYTPTSVCDCEVAELPTKQVCSALLTTSPSLLLSNSWILSLICISL